MIAYGLRLAGLVVAGWAVVRVVALLSGNDDVVAADDPHGYVAIFSLVVLIPVLALTVGTLLADLRRHRARTTHRGDGPQQADIIDTEQANLHDTALTAVRRDHARDAIRWATSDRSLIQQHKALLLSALQR